MNEGIMLSQNKYIGLNHNIMVVGPSGSGKNFSFHLPNILQMTGSYIINDPCGQLYSATADVLKENGYDVKVLNLCEPDKSMHYDPFVYINTYEDIVNLVNLIIANTSELRQSKTFGSSVEAVFLQSLFIYVWKEGVEDKNGKLQHNMKALLEFINSEDFPDKFDKKIETLAVKEKDHPACAAYYKYKQAASNYKPFIISALSRLSVFNNPSFAEFFSKDDFDLSASGTKKTAIFCILPTYNNTFNFIATMFYFQAIHTLFSFADSAFSGCLPVHVTFIFDELVNIIIPDDIITLLSIIKSKNISCIMTIQCFEQVQVAYKDYENSILDICDIFVKMLREDNCVVLIKGEKVVFYDKKIDVRKHPLFSKVML